MLSSHPGPPGTGLYPLLNTSIDNELVILPSPAVPTSRSRRSGGSSVVLFGASSRSCARDDANDFNRRAEPVENTGGATGPCRPQPWRGLGYAADPPPSSAASRCARGGQFSSVVDRTRFGITDWVRRAVFSLVPCPQDQGPDQAGPLGRSTGAGRDRGPPTRPEGVSHERDRGPHRCGRRTMTEPGLILVTGAGGGVGGVGGVGRFARVPFGVQHGGGQLRVVRPGPGVEVVAADRRPDIVDDADLGVHVDRHARWFSTSRICTRSAPASRTMPMASAWPSVAGST